MGLVIVGMAVAAGPAAAQDIRFFRIGTGPTSGTYFSIGGTIANAISNPPGSRPCDRGGSCGVPGLIALAQSTNGSVENVETVAGGGLESALVQADVVYWAYHGTGLFHDRGPSPDLRAIANILVSTVHIVVPGASPVRGVSDLRGKRVSLGERGSGTLIVAKTVLAAHGLSEAEVEASYLKPGPASDRLADGGLDAFFALGAVPLTAVADLAGRLPVRLLPITGTAAADLIAFQPFFAEADIEAGAYSNVGRTQSIGINTQWIVSTAADPDLVYAVTRALWHERNRPLFENGHPEGRKLQLEKALSHIAIPLHPGAARFYEEQGVRRF